LSDAKYYPKIIHEERRNGQFVTETVFERSRSDLESGKITLETSVRVYGSDLQKKEIQIMVAKTQAPTSSTLDMCSAFAGLDPHKDGDRDGSIYTRVRD
jgi:hypothetical protein